MSLNLDIKNWDAFLVHKIFKIGYGSKLDIGKMTHDNPTINFVSRTACNNGVCDVVDLIPTKKPYKAGALTLALGGSIGSCFVQEQDFYTSQNVAVLEELEDLSQYTKLFVAKIIEKECKTRYKAFGRELNSHINTDLCIMLPKTKDGKPNWQFMNDYMISLFDKAETETKEIIKISKGDVNTIVNLSNKVNAEDFNKWVDNKQRDKVELRTENWQEFKIGDLFKTYTGGDLIIGNIEEGDIPVISHSAANNSVKAYSQNIPNKKLFDHRKTISLADRGTFFATIQPEDFYIGTRVKALEALYENITKHMLIFIATIINNEKYKFSYGRNCTDNLDSVIIKLPTLKLDNGAFQPNWQFMEDYIKSLPYSNRI